MPQKVALKRTRHSRESEIELITINITPCVLIVTTAITTSHSPKPWP